MKESNWKPLQKLSPPALAILLLLFAAFGAKSQTMTTSFTLCDKNKVRNLSANEQNSYNHQYVSECTRVEDDYIDGVTERAARRTCKYEKTIYYDRVIRNWKTVVTDFYACTKSNSKIIIPSGWHPPLKLQ